MAKNMRRPKKANHGKRPCSHLARRRRRINTPR
ncbi:MAG: 50S ribosomal protein bL37 [Planctomycetota bacterium]